MPYYTIIYKYITKVNKIFEASKISSKIFKANMESKKEFKKLLYSIDLGFDIEKLLAFLYYQDILYCYQISFEEIVFNSFLDRAFKKKFKRVTR